MSRTAAAAATMTLALWGLSGAVQAQTAAPAASAAPARQPADAATRASYDRADALSRSVFWSQEQQINPMDPMAGVKLAQALREMGQFDQAAETAQSVLTVQPANLEAMLEVGRAHIARGQAFYGIAALEQARAAAPRDWRPLSLLGVAYQQVRRSDDAKAAWNEALHLSPDNPDVLTNAAIARMGEGDAPSAEILLRRAVAQPGATLKVRQNLALALGLQGKTAEAEQILRRDLPPEVADANLRWLAERTAASAAVAPAAATAGAVRTWSSVQGG
ncbi:tetratricopeptide repeat protein [Brevundimonas pondensis]|uniref:Tetratricopeptide repeat protein n=1 Tax=Brevundimonas pondensis TaxID=2774189 RepID=A0ABX7SKE3_9CAUL|nr:tetratricopeptide repeat protein [Brevundimonas pondensis]QTC87355.1 tetratricopeptide repeat protein [Brevundimonas pondensis]